MPQNLFLHIGLHKTGTSYLQKRLLHNQVLLERHGLTLAQGFDPLTGNHHTLLRHLPPKGDLAHFIAAATTDKPTLLTSECLITWFMRSAHAKAVAELLLQRFEIRIILILRRQDYLKESIYSEVATSWYQGKIEDESHYWYNFETIIDRLASLFGAERLRIGVYRDDERNDPMSEFLRCCELPLKVDQLEEIPPQRVSLDRRKTTLLAACPKHPRETFNLLREAIAKSPSIQPDTYRYILSPQQRYDFLVPFLESNRRLCQRFCPEAEAYMSSPASLHEDWRPALPLTTGEVANLLMELSNQMKSLVDQQHGATS